MVLCLHYPFLVVSVLCEIVFLILFNGPPSDQSASLITFVCAPTSQYLCRLLFWLLQLCPDPESSTWKVLTPLFRESPWFSHWNCVGFRGLCVWNYTVLPSVSSLQAFHTMFPASSPKLSAAPLAWSDLLLASLNALVLRPKLPQAHLDCLHFPGFLAGFAVSTCADLHCRCVLRKITCVAPLKYD